MPENKNLIKFRRIKALFMIVNVMMALLVFILMIMVLQ